MFEYKQLFENIRMASYIIDYGKIEENCKILSSVRKRTGCKILLAQKAFSAYALYPMISKYLDGTTASGYYEARLGHSKFGGETHIFAPAYTESDFEDVAVICDHISFNSLSQWEKHRDKCNGKAVSLRVNPEYSEVETEIYNPCAVGSRLGIKADKLKNYDFTGITGLHFHTMCEQNSDVLKRTLPHLEEKFGEILHKMDFLNMGGGHHITKDDYDIDTLCDCIEYMQNKYNLQVYLEPGEAIAYNGGYLVAEVLDIVENGIQIVILDTSAACHMPDVLEMPYRPHIIGTSDDFPYKYRLGGNTCLSGDIIGDYGFEKPIEIGQKLIFTDMAIYTMVKNNTFNGIKLPDIYILKDCKIIQHKCFGYHDFFNRL